MSRFRLCFPIDVCYSHYTLCLCIWPLWPFSVNPTFSHAMISRLYTMPAHYLSNYFSLTNFSKYESNRKQSQILDILSNLEILARACPGKRGCAVWSPYMWINVMIFISCLNSGNHWLQKIHWWASDVMLNFSKETNSSWMALGWPFHF